MAGSTRDHTIRRVRDAALVVIAFLMLAGPALAWEFEMKGEWENRLRYFSRIGNNDLFGIASLQEGSTSGIVGILTGPFVGFAGPNTWDTGAFASANADNAGVIITRGGFSTWGCDAAIHDQKMTLIPTIKVNDAIRVHGVYTVGGYRNKYHQTSLGVVSGVGVPPFERWYMHDSSPNAAYNTAAIGSWEQIRATFNTPWATFSIGVKDFPLGTGLNLAYATRANAFLTVVPYGPFRFLHGIWLTDKVGASESYVMSPDRSGANAQNSLFQGAFFTFRSGPVEIGGGRIQLLRHFNEGARLAIPDISVNAVTDFVLGQNLAYFKFSNGRLFANGEYMWQTNDVYPVALGNAMSVAAFNSGATQTYTELYNVLVEAGAIFGPSKFTALWVQTSGPVLNNGGNVGMQAALNPGAGLNPKRYGAAAAVYQVLEPYEYLMFYTYGGGNQTFHADGTGQMSDAYAFAGRIDHAVASNLNLYGTFIWAHRLEKAGTWFGQFNNDGSPALTGTFAAATALAATYDRNNPFVEDGFIGWEADAGVDWKLLEGLTLKSRYAYWQPGDYFKEAWRAVGLRNVGGVPTVVGDAMFLSRDPIHAIQGSILIDF